MLMGFCRWPLRIAAASGARHGLGNGAFVYVADSAMVTENSLSQIGENKFVSRLPASYAVCGERILEAVDSDGGMNLTGFAGTLNTMVSVYFPVDLES